MKQTIFGALLVLAFLAPLCAMEELGEKEPVSKEHIIVRGIRIQLKNGTSKDILLNIDEHEPYILLKPEEKYAIKSDEVNSVKAGYVGYATFTLTARWHTIDIKKIEDSHWLDDAEAVIKPGFRNNLYIGDNYQITTSLEVQREYTAQQWANHLLENSKTAQLFFSMKRASKEEVEAAYQAVLEEINQGQWVDADFTNLVREYCINSVFKTLQDIITGIEIELKNETKYDILIKIAKQPLFELKDDESYVLNTQEIKKINIGYKTPSFSIGLSSRWTEIQLRDLEKIYRQQAVLIHLKPGLNNNINISAIDKKGNLLSISNGFQLLSEKDFDRRIN